MVFETAYIWTWDGNDNANNIISEVHSDYAPPSPEVQRQWMIDLTAEVLENGGTGVIYWEPAWISSACYTQWGQGSHQEHATFFDFENNLMDNGGINWMTYNYTTAAEEPTLLEDFTCYLSEDQRLLHLEFLNTLSDSIFQLKILNAEGKTLLNKRIEAIPQTRMLRQLAVPELPAGIYVVSLFSGSKIACSRKVVVR